MAASAPIIATTIITSMSVKPSMGLRTWGAKKRIGVQGDITILLRVKIRIMPPVSPAHTDGRFGGGDERKVKPHNSINIRHARLAKLHTRLNLGKH
jgi:hypothetical protein